MSFPNGFVLTTLGLALQAKAQTGTTLSFTKMQAGDGTLSGQVPSELTALINVKISSIPITGFKKPSPTVAAVMAYFNNSSLSTGFYLREIGLFATDPDLGEILYAYGNAGSSAEYIPAYGGASIIEKNVSLNCIIGNAANVSAIIDFSKVYLTAQDAETTYIKKSLATAASQFLVSSAAGQWAIKTVAEIKSLLGLGSAAYTDSTTYAAYGGTTTNTGNAYSLDYSASLVTGLGISFKCNADSTGAVTLNVNGTGTKSILRGNGTAVSNLKANSIYTLRYNGTNFILQGDGGEYGTAEAAQVLTGYTIGTDSGIANGSMPDKRRDPNATYSYIQVKSVKADGVGNLVYEPYTGYYESGLTPLGYGSIIAFDENFVASNVANGKSIFGLIGSNTNKKWSSGTSVSISGSQASFTKYDGTTINSYYCTVTHNLGWQPSIIIVLGPTGTNSAFTIFDTYASRTVASNVVTGSAVGFQNSGNLFSTINAFQLPINNNTGAYSWIAYE